MKLTSGELEFLSAWAREEWEPECYQRPAHRLQLAHGVPGANLIDLIKAWTLAERRKDEDILQAGRDPEPPWPWRSPERFKARWQEACDRRALQRMSITKASLPASTPALG